MVDKSLKLPSKALLFKMLSGLESSHDWALIAFGDLLERGDRIIDVRGQGNQDYYDLMVDSDAVLSGLIETRITAVAGLDNRVDAASDEPRDLEIAEFISHAFARMGDFDEKLADILSACRTGFSVMEIIWGELIFNGKEMLAPIELIPRRPERFRFDINYHLRLLTPNNRLAGEEVPNAKFIIHSFRPRYNNPYGTSLCRTVWWYWWFKHHAYKWWLQAAERGAVVTPVGTYPSHMNEEEQEPFRKSMKTFLGNKYILKPEGTTVDFPHIKIDPNFCKNLTESCDEQMRSGILGSTLSTGTAESGTRALGQVHDKRLQERIEADAKALMATINAQLVHWMVLLNYPEPDKFPMWALNYNLPKDQKEMRENIKLGAEMGIPISVQWTAEALQIEVAKEGEDLIVPPPPRGAGLPNPTLSDTGGEPEDEMEDLGDESATAVGFVNGAARKANAESAKIYQENAKRLVREAAKHGYPVYLTLGDQIEAWLNTKSTLEEALATVKYFQLDDTDFAEYLTEAMFLSDCRGFFDLFTIAEAKGLYKAKRGILAKIKRRLRGALFGQFEDELWVPVPPDEAIEHFEKRDILTREELEILEAADRRDAFTAANLSTETIERRLKPALSKAIADGSTLREFTKQVDDIVLSKAHAENIFRTNIMTSYNQGHAEAIWSPELKEIIPAFLYDGVLDERTTDICATRIGEVYPRDFLTSGDVVAPCHFQCRSSMVEVWADEWDGRTSSLPSIPAQEGFGRWSPALPPRVSK